MFQQALAVFLVLGLLLGALWLLRRQGYAKFNFLANSGLANARLIGRKSGVTRHMRVVERVALTPQHSLHLVSINDRLVVFTVSPNGCHAVDPAALNPTDHELTVSLEKVAAC